MNNKKIPLKVIITLVGTLLLVTCATQRSIKEESDPLYGTWINSEYSKDFKQIYSADGKVLSYNKNQPNDPEYLGQFLIEKKWTDAKGNSWYHLKVQWNPGGIRTVVFFTLVMINAPGDTLEFEEARSEYPEKFSNFIGEKYNHKILYRQ